MPIEDEREDEREGKEEKRNIHQPTEAGREEQATETERGKEREGGVATKEEKAKESTQQQRKPQTKHWKRKIDETEMANGYMNSHGKPRQPKETQMNQAKTLLYDKETETWQCLKCENIYGSKCKECTKPCNITQKERRKRKD